MVESEKLEKATRNLTNFEISDHPICSQIKMRQNAPAFPCSNLKT